jgi:hypothetical protein
MGLHCFEIDAIAFAHDNPEAIYGPSPCLSIHIHSSLISFYKASLLLSYICCL